MTDWIKYKLLDLPVLASKHGHDVDNFILYVHTLMAALFIGWLTYFLYALYRFRQSKNPKADYVGVKGHVSTYLEGVVALVEVILLIGFAVPLWAKAVGDPPVEKDATEIYILGRQFNWNGHYAGPDGKFGKQDPKLSSGADPFGVDRTDPDAKDDVVVQGNFVVPVNKPVIAHVSSLDVIHSFAIRSMRVCQDATPGFSIATWFTPTKIGEYKITCAQLCGLGHYGMSAVLHVVSSADYQKWLADKAAEAKKAGAAPVSYE